jgi:hypothetical protein
MLLETLLITHSVASESRTYVHHVQMSYRPVVSPLIYCLQISIEQHEYLGALNHGC